MWLDTTCLIPFFRLACKRGRCFSDHKKRATRVQWSQTRTYCSFAEPPSHQPGTSNSSRSLLKEPEPCCLEYEYIQVPVSTKMPRCGTGQSRQGGLPAVPHGTPQKLTTLIPLQWLAQGLRTDTEPDP